MGTRCKYENLKALTINVIITTHNIIESRCHIIWNIFCNNDILEPIRKNFQDA